MMPEVAFAKTELPVSVRPKLGTEVFTDAAKTNDTEFASRPEVSCVSRSAM